MQVVPLQPADIFRADAIGVQVGELARRQVVTGAFEFRREICGDTTGVQRDQIRGAEPVAGRVEIAQVIDADPVRFQVHERAGGELGITRGTSVPQVIERDAVLAQLEQFRGGSAQTQVTDRARIFQRDARLQEVEQLVVARGGVTELLQRCDKGGIGPERPRAGAAAEVHASFADQCARVLPVFEPNGTGVVGRSDGEVLQAAGGHVAGVSPEIAGPDAADVQVINAGVRRLLQFPFLPVLPHADEDGSGKNHGQNKGFPPIDDGFHITPDFLSRIS